MTITEVISPHLPYLRRFARALCGNQEAGDAYVIASLEALVQDNSLFNKELPARIALYRLFLNIWNRVPINGKTVPAPPGVQALDALTPPSRQAFLLTSVEGFSPEDAALIMDRELSEFERMAQQAGKEIAEQVATEVLIIEDEAIIAMDIEALVESLGHTVIDIARTRAEAVSMAQKRRPGLVLADIQLADGSSGLDAVNEMLESFEVPVIFVTAYPERLLTGAKPEPAFLITKPFQASTLKAVISQALFFNQASRKSKAA
ncbi:MAG: response regulator [Rhizobiales bacterium 65-9]|nr:response regulator [Hyphomicrobiales bacterium]OJY39239.1 MAG: response regulator [Rhizobiales bacterium 65-9]